MSIWQKIRRIWRRRACRFVGHDWTYPVMDRRSMAHDIAYRGGIPIYCRRCGAESLDLVP